jgi:hypothetical protein
MKSKSKVVLSISIDNQLFKLIAKNISNKSKYIEWLIYQDMKNNDINEIKKIII